MRKVQRQQNSSPFTQLFDKVHLVVLTTHPHDAAMVCDTQSDTTLAVLRTDILLLCEPSIALAIYSILQNQVVVLGRQRLLIDYDQAPQSLTALSATGDVCISVPPVSLLATKSSVVSTHPLLLSWWQSLHLPGVLPIQQCLSMFADARASYRHDMSLVSPW